SADIVMMFPSPLKGMRISRNYSHSGESGESTPGASSSSESLSGESGESAVFASSASSGESAVWSSTSCGAGGGACCTDPSFGGTGAGSSGESVVLVSGALAVVAVLAVLLSRSLGESAVLVVSVESAPDCWSASWTWAGALASFTSPPATAVPPTAIAPPIPTAAAATTNQGRLLLAMM